MIPIWIYRVIMQRSFGHLGFETTNICNADCSFCGYRFMERSKMTMPFDIYSRALDEYVSSGGGALSFTPTVGDPLVDKDIISKIKYASQYSQIKSISMYTNGILLDRIGIKELLQSGLSRLAISTYIGTSQGYLKYYGVDKYEKTLQNIISISKTNRYFDSPIHITLHLRVEIDKDSWRKTQTYKEITRWINEEDISYLTLYDNWSGLIKVTDIPYGTELDNPVPIEEKIKSPCFELYRRVHILADGNVGCCVCRDMEGEINIGNINESSIDDIWNGPLPKQYRQNWSKKGILPEVCVECTRYQAVDEYIKENRKETMFNYLVNRSPLSPLLARYFKIHHPRGNASSSAVPKPTTGLPLS